MKYLLFVLLALVCIQTHADVYKVTNEDGNITYSDVPSKNAEIVIVPQVPVTQTSSGAIPTSTTPDKDTATDTPSPAALLPSMPNYTSFTLIAPKDEETIQNQFNIVVTFKIEPKLQKDDSIQVYLDGNPIGPVATTEQIALGQIERGTHQIFGRIINKQNTTLKQSNTVVVYIHNASAASPTVHKPPTT